MGKPLYPKASRLTITADCGGGNGYRGRLWKVALQLFADETGLTVRCAICPPAPASGTRSNIACSATSRRTGAASHSKASPLLLNSSATPPRRKGSEYEPKLTRHPTRKAKKYPTKKWPSCNSAQTISRRVELCHQPACLYMIVQLIIANCLSCLNYLPNCRARLDFHEPKPW
jgi:hypothetical protein